MRINRKSFLDAIKAGVYGKTVAKIKRVKGGVKDRAGAIKSKTKSGSINRKFRRTLMEKIDTTDTGEENYNTIKSKVNSFLKTGNARGARLYINSQVKKIAQQKKALLNK